MVKSLSLRGFRKLDRYLVMSRAWLEYLGIRESSLASLISLGGSCGPRGLPCLKPTSNKVPTKALDVYEGLAILGKPLKPRVEVPPTS